MACHSDRKLALRKTPSEVLNIDAENGVMNTILNLLFAVATVSAPEEG